MITRALIITTLLASSIAHAAPPKGKLGKPLGTVVTISGTMLSGDSLGTKSAEGKMFLNVKRINGRKLSNPVVLTFRFFKWVSPFKLPKHGKRFKLIGYESGEYRGIPADAFKYVPHVATQGFHFASYFQILKEK